MVDVIVTGYKGTPGPSDEPQSIPREVRWLFQASSTLGRSVLDQIRVGRRSDEFSLYIDCETDLETAMDAVPLEARVWC
jgi:hypothetical protein